MGYIFKTHDLFNNVISGVDKTRMVDYLNIINFTKYCKYSFKRGIRNVRILNNFKCYCYSNIKVFFTIACSCKRH